MNFSTLTAKPHIAGSTDDHDLADLIYKQWSGYNFDKVEMVNYSVLVSYPNSSAPNVLNLMQGSEVIYTAHTGQEPPLTPGEDDGDVVPPYVAYSGNGTVKVSYAPVIRIYCWGKPHTSNIDIISIHMYMYNRIVTIIPYTFPHTFEY